ncbi:Formamidopyrimidine-DNA glycosylase N-terminal domain-containing protein [Pelagophyceae sp. CCMP2097]|nr:Formamidopyrimidine-DNA glycosylase N-terminal domain-containing protein [Pelagophyceae sp. CCMP2097]
MPELPECERARALLHECAVGLIIERVVALEQGGGPREGLFDDRVLEGSAAAFTEALVDLRVLAAKRKGKQLWLELGGGVPKALLIHHGMTGAVVIEGRKAMNYKTFAVDDAAWPPKFAKFELVLRGDDGAATNVAFVDARRFGRVRVRGAGAAGEEISSLAPDALDALPDAEAMVAKLAGKATTIKAVLLDQNFLVSGIGNWVADECLYHAGIDPASAANALDAAHVAALRAAIGDVCARATSANADSEEFPDTWLFHHRWANQKTGSISSPIGRIHFATVGGRTTAFVPDKQKLFRTKRSSDALAPTKKKTRKH